MGTRLAQQPDAIAATAHSADRPRRIRSTAYTADWPRWIRSTADTADWAWRVGSTAYAADRAGGIAGANAANRSRWIGSSSTWHNGFSFVTIQAPGTFRQIQMPGTCG